LSVDGDAEAGVEARVRAVGNKFKQLVPLLTNKDVSLLMRQGRSQDFISTEAKVESLVRGPGEAKPP